MKIEISREIIKEFIKGLKTDDMTEKELDIAIWLLDYTIWLLTGELNKCLKRQIEHNENDIIKESKFN